MTPTLTQWLNNEGTMSDWAEEFGLTRARVSLIRTGAVMPMAKEIERIARVCDVEPSEVAQALRAIHRRRWRSVLARLDGREVPFIVGRQGRPPKV